MRNRRISDKSRIIEKRYQNDGRDSGLKKPRSLVNSINKEGFILEKIDQENRILSMLISTEWNEVEMGYEYRRITHQREETTYPLLLLHIAHKFAIAAARSIFEERVLLVDLLYFLLRKTIDSNKGFRRPTKLLSTGLRSLSSRFYFNTNYNKNQYE